MNAGYDDGNCGYIVHWDRSDSGKAGEKGNGAFSSHISPKDFKRCREQWIRHRYKMHHSNSNINTNSKGDGWQRLINRGWTELKNGVKAIWHYADAYDRQEGRF